jgi:hypothetical protein
MVAPTLEPPHAIGVDETSVYWEDGALFKVAKAGGAVTTLLGGSGLSGDAGLLDRGCGSLLSHGVLALGLARRSARSWMPRAWRSSSDVPGERYGIVPRQ